jgi:hypothetical protein
MVIVETDSLTPVVGIPWVFTLLVDYPLPEDVAVLAPSFTDVLFLDRFLKSPRVAEGHTWTTVEYSFVPQTSGLFTLELFTVICPLGVTETTPLVLDIREADERQKILVPRIVWERTPSLVTAGERAVFTLRANGWNSQKPPADFFLPEVPQGVILELSSLSAGDRTGGIAARFTVIPLDAGEFLLPARTLYYENVRFEIPVLRIRASGIPAAEGQTPVPDTVAPSEVQLLFPEIDFSAFDDSVTRKIRRDQYENIYNNARELWDRGLPALALAELRRNERDHPAGALLRPVRREAEENLGFLNTGDERRGQRGLSIFLFFIVIFSLVVCFILIRVFGRQRAAFLCIIVLVSALGLYWFADSFGRNSRFGVTNATPVRRAADYAGEELFSFREGQPVLILQDSGSWVYVQANGAAGEAGWIPKDAVIFY